MPAESDHDAGDTAPAALDVRHATSVHIAVNNSDFVVVFSLAKPLFANSIGLIPGAVLEVVAAVDMSPSTSKQLMKALQQAIGNFEQTTGSVIPDLGGLSWQRDTLENA